MVVRSERRRLPFVVRRTPRDSGPWQVHKRRGPTPRGVRESRAVRWYRRPVRRRRVGPGARTAHACIRWAAAFRRVAICPAASAPGAEVAGPPGLLRGLRGWWPACAGTPGSSMLDPGSSSVSCASVCSSCLSLPFWFVGFFFRAPLPAFLRDDPSPRTGFPGPGSRRRVAGPGTDAFCHGLHSFATVLSGFTDAGRLGPTRVLSKLSRIDRFQLVAKRRAGIATQGTTLRYTSPGGRSSTAGSACRVLTLIHLPPPIGRAIRVFVPGSGPYRRPAAPATTVGRRRQFRARALVEWDAFVFRVWLTKTLDRSPFAGLPGAQTLRAGTRVPSLAVSNAGLFTPLKPCCGSLLLGPRRFSTRPRKKPCELPGSQGLHNSSFSANPTEARNQTRANYGP